MISCFIRIFSILLQVIASVKFGKEMPECYKDCCNLLPDIPDIPELPEPRKHKLNPSNKSNAIREYSQGY